MLHCYRLDPAIDAEDMQLIRDLFAGGESRRMGPNSIAVRIEDTRSQNTPDTFQSLQSGNHNVSVRVFQSFQVGRLGTSSSVATSSLVNLVPDLSFSFSRILHAWSSERGFCIPSSCWIFSISAWCLLSTSAVSLFSPGT